MSHKSTTLNLPYSEREIKIEGFDGRSPFGGRPGALGHMPPKSGPDDRHWQHITIPAWGESSATVFRRHAIQDIWSWSITTQIHIQKKMLHTNYICYTNYVFSADLWSRHSTYTVTADKSRRRHQSWVGRPFVASLATTVRDRQTVDWQWLPRSIRRTTVHASPTTD